MINWRSVLFGICSLAQAACMLSPGDGGVVEGMGTVVRFNGYDHRPAAEVDVQAFDRFTDRFERIGRALSTDVPFVYDDIKLYPWSTELTIPTGFWIPGAAGSKVRVKAVSGDAELYSAKANLGCVGETDGSIGQLALHCAGEHSPEAHVTTKRFVPWSDRTDFVLWEIWGGEAGRLRVIVLNAGAAGTVSKIECSDHRRGTEYFVNEPVARGAWPEYGPAFTPRPGRPVTCTVFGTNADGSPDANPANNTAVRSL